MRAVDFVEAIQTILMDILAFLIPGAVFLVVTWFFIGDEIAKFVNIVANIPPASIFDWFIVGLLSYISGYILQGIGEGWIIHITENFTKFRALRWLLPGIQPYENLEKQINESQWFKEARRRIASYVKADLSSLDFRELRNIAMSISPGWVRYVYRYTYTWQLCSGAAIGLLISGMALLLVALASLIPASGISFSAAKFLWLLLLLPSAVFLLNRRYRYYSITMRIPFSIALAVIPQLENQSFVKHAEEEHHDA